MPTLLPQPWPSGPVVASTPVVRPYSGWPGVTLSIWRKFLMSSRLIAGVSVMLLPSAPLHAGKMHQRVKQHGGVAVGQHEAVAVRP